MKKVIFSSVCAVALLGVNANASWIDDAGISFNYDYAFLVNPSSNFDKIKNTIFTDGLTEGNIDVAVSSKIGKAFEDALVKASAGVTLKDTVVAYKKLQAAKALNEIAAHKDLKTAKLVNDTTITESDALTEAQAEQIIGIFNKYGIKVGTDLATTKTGLLELIKATGLLGTSAVDSSTFVAKTIDITTLETTYNEAKKKIEAKLTHADVVAAAANLKDAMDYYKGYAQTALEVYELGKKHEAVIDKASAIESLAEPAYHDVIYDQKGVFTSKEAVEKNLANITNNELAVGKDFEKVPGTAYEIKAESTISSLATDNAKLSLAQAIKFLETTSEDLNSKVTDLGGSKAEAAKNLKVIKDAIDAGKEIPAAQKAMVANFVTLFTDSTNSGKVVLTLSDDIATKYNEAVAALKNISDAELVELNGVYQDVMFKLSAFKASFNPASQALVAEIGKSLNMFSGKVNLLNRIALVNLLTNTDGTPVDLAALKAKVEAKDEAAIKQLNEIQAVANNLVSSALEGNKDSLATQIQGVLNVQVNNMNKRLGEVRGLNGDIGVWLRAYGGRYSNDTNSFNVYSTQLGADKKIEMSNGDLIVGGLFGYDYSKDDAKTKTYSLGLYGSYIDNNGFFTDVVFKYANAKHSHDSIEYKKQNIFLLSFEGGYRFNVNESFYVEPSLELITGHVGKYEAKAAKVVYSSDAYTPFIIKPQVFVGYEVDALTLRLGVGGEFNTKRQDVNMNVTDLVKGLNANGTTRLDRNSHGFASIGGSYKVNDNLRFNLGVERSFGGSLTKDYEINATVRYTF